MDILNFISWIKKGRYFPTVNPATTLLPIGLKDPKRDDGYLAGAMTVADLATQIVPAPTYKVFTALLTQSGGDFLDQLDYSTPTQNVTKGVTYIIVNADNGDFTNVGAPSNIQGTSFIAINDEIPNSWGQDGAGLIFNTGAPVATVLENTIGNIWFSYSNVGNYVCNFLPTSDFNKTLCLATNNDSAQNYGIGPLEIGSYIDGQINIVNWDITGNLFNGMYQAIEIRVYE